MSTIWQITNSDRVLLGRNIRQLLDSAGARDWLGAKEAPAVLKPNLVVSKPAADGATTHLEVAAAVLEWLIDLGRTIV